jgi:tetratricopeptide (TPR) repeat protein
MPRMMAVMLLSGLATLYGAHAQTPASDARPEQSDTVVTHADDLDHGTHGVGIVTVNELRLPAKVIKELQLSNLSIVNGDLRGSAEHLQRAIALDPALPVAHNALGSRYAELTEFDKALDEFAKALALNPHYHLALDNTAVVLCLQHRFAEAESFARRALQLEPQSPSSEYLLGGILVQHKLYTDEATSLLEKAADTYPRAWFFLAKASQARGNKPQAAEQLRHYLQCPGAIERKAAQNWLDMLEAQQPADKSAASNSGPG